MNNEKKVVAFIIPSLEVGGAEHQTINQLNYLKNDTSIVLKLIVLSRKNSLLPKLEIPNSDVHILEKNSYTSLESGLFKKIPYIVTNLSSIIVRYGITDVIAILPMAHFSCRLAKAKIGKRHPFTLNAYYRDVYYQVSPMNSILKKLFNYLNKKLAAKFDNKTIFISDAVYKDIEQNFFVRDPLILPNSLPKKNVSEKEGIIFLNNLGISREIYLMLIPGRLHFKKGHLLFIDAFEEFVNTIPLIKQNIKVLIVGEGAMRNKIHESINTKSLQENFILTGTLENELLLSLFKCVNLVIIPSLFEGFGNVAIEGLMQKSIMLVSDTGGLAEIIRNGENGFKFDCGDKNSLSEMLSFIYRNQNDIKIEKENLYLEYEQKYTLERQLEKIRNHCNF